jgi:type III restriction enzyme
MAFVLKQYQERCLEALERFLRRAKQIGAKLAFMEQTDRPYHSVDPLPGLPYVCLRVPTGGGKTVLAAHAVGKTAQEFLRSDRCTVLWLVPTNTIRQQTIDALKDRKHPYRQALDVAFGGNISVIDLTEALYVQRGVLEGDTVVIVSTLAALRVENTEGRKIYETNGALQHHFSGLNEVQLAELEKAGNGNGNGNGIIYSLANVLRLHRPVVIMDEAHNARTTLSFDTLARFNPSCILEFTATPDEMKNPSNVLYSVSAMELKAEAMIKLPIRLKTRSQWKEAVGEAIDKQRELERLAREEEKETSEYIRPIVLLQAQSKSKENNSITFEELKRFLMDDFEIPEEEIAVATGEKDELGGVDVLSRDCRIRFIITVAKLREGWDCPFAYILCSVSNLSSKTAVEQVLGRILRLPKVTWKNREELNHAFAFVTSQQFNDAAVALQDALVESGFERFEAKMLVKPYQAQEIQYGPLFNQEFSETISEKPDLTHLPKELKESVRYEPAKKKIVYIGPAITEKQKETLQETVTTEDDKQAIERLCLKSQGKPVYPAALGKKLSVPMLAIRFGDQLELFEDQFREALWNLTDFDPLLTENELPQSVQDGKTADVDLNEAGKIEYSFVQELHRQLAFWDIRGPKTPAELALWLDRSIEHPDITQTQSSLFLRQLIQALMEQRDFTFEQLLQERFRLREAAEEKIRSCRKQAAEQSFNQMLLPDIPSPIEVSPEVCFTFPLNQYPANRIYQGPIRFPKHYYEIPGEMNHEEIECATILDTHPNVQYWIRNLERQPACSFWLPTSTDKFYPDFVAVLKDGRFLVVEYKGKHLVDNTDTKEKKMIGELWEAKSNGQCLFRLITKQDLNSTNFIPSSK